MAAKVVKNDTVVMLTGRDRGKEGKVLRVLPTAGRIVVEGLNRRIRHVKARQAGEPAGRVEFDAPVAVSNVAVVCTHCKKGVRVGFKVLDDGVKVRICRGCGEIVEKRVSSDG